MKKWLSNKRVRQPLFLFNYLLSEQILVTVLNNDAFVGLIHLATHNIVHRSIYVQLSRSHYIFYCCARTLFSDCQSLAGRDDGGVVSLGQSKYSNCIFS